MKTYTRIENRIMSVITDEFKIANRYLASDANLKEDLGLDEYDMIFLSLALEDEFEMVFHDQLNQVEEVKDIVPFIVANFRQGNYLN